MITLKSEITDFPLSFNTWKDNIHEEEAIVPYEGAKLMGHLKVIIDGREFSFLKEMFYLFTLLLFLELILSEAGVTFDNSFFDNSFDFLRQLKNGSFLGSVFVHVTGQSKN
jgi:hypothetical protein